ncbi:hypothetical protein AAF712_001970 [Marasmius tenuissimus]|uniref:Uncharacterized protein n=1 Tax=Marasmius tenuissimus TaxID=585030 RepID=A0ABR3ACQ0_9AGAR
MDPDNLPLSTESLRAGATSMQTYDPGASSSTSDSVEMKELGGKSSETKNRAKREDKRTSGVSVTVVQVEAGTGLERDLLIVDWDIDDPENPRNWSRRRKFTCTTLLAALTFLTPLSSTMIAPAGRTIAEEFHITDEFIVNMVTSVFVLAYAFGPLIIGPLRQLIAFRFLSGIGGSAPFSVSGGILGDIWSAEERGTANGLYTVGAVLGTGVGPVCGAWIAEKTSWRWVVCMSNLFTETPSQDHTQFWATSVVDGIFVVLFFLLLDETYPPVLLARRAAKLRAQRGLPKGDLSVIRTKYESPDWTLGAFIWKSVIRPFELTIQEPIIQAVGAYMTFLYGLVYLVLTTIPDITLVLRQESLGVSGLHYIAHCIGAVGAAYFSMRTLDPLYRYLKTRHDGQGRPEFRLPVLILGTILLPIGTLIIGWTASPRLHWIGTDVGLLLVAAGTDLNFQPMTTYLIDAFTLHAASALAAVTFFRSIAGFAFPLFAPAMFHRLGYGLGCTVLAVIAIVLGCPTPFILWRYGPTLRAKSRYSAGPSTD